MRSLYVNKKIARFSSSCYIMSEIKSKGEQRYGNRKNKHHGQ